ncbi:MAG: type IV pilus assembly protein PilM [Actinomycetota bacterium]|nr:type IV pilus assembly protein PilM [Actinomycetota bacterium]
MAGRTAIGLDIGTSGVRVAQLRFGRGTVTLERFGQVVLPDGAVRDGEVADPAAVAVAIRQLWAHTRMSGKKVLLGVASGRVIVRQVDLAWLPPSELRRSLPFQVADILPMPVEAAVLDFYPLEELPRRDGVGRAVRGLLVAASRETVHASVQAVQRAGLTPISVDLTSFAILRALGSGQDGGSAGEDAEALVDVGAKVTNVVVHQGGVPRFVRILPMGGQHVTDAVAERAGLPPEQAEALKHELGLGLGPHVFTAEGQAAARAVEDATSALVGEVQTSLTYYAAAGAAAPVSRIVLTGGGARLAGLPERLQAAADVPVVLGTPIAALRLGAAGLSEEQLREVSPLATVPVGLALGAAR